ncbi:RCC1 domain-containing protein [Streptomyces sp. NBC_01224]|nr:RCC1 domain-containing protein [Streptomyces sp. NBC_01224]
MSVGCYHVLALTADGAVKSWGYNGFGQLGKSSFAY